jgi:hypothetical protein
VTKVTVLRPRLLVRRTGSRLPSASTSSLPINCLAMELSESLAASPRAAEVLRPRPERWH